MKRAGAWAVVIAILVSACHSQSEMRARELRHIKTVAVISVLGGTFLFQHITDRSFEWLGPADSHFLAISDWGLDEKITKDITALLARHYAVKTVLFDPADFSTWDDDLLQRSVLNLNCDPGIDAFVLVLRDWQGDRIGRSGHDLGGLGLYRRDGAEPKYGVFASYRVVVVNALTGKVIVSRKARLKDGSLPWTQATWRLWPKTQNDLTPEQRAELIAEETQLIQSTLQQTLSRTGLAR